MLRRNRRQHGSGLLDMANSRSILRQGSEPKWICYVLYILILNNLYYFRGSSERCSLVFTKNWEKTPANGLQVYKMGSRKVFNRNMLLQLLSVALHVQSFFLHDYQLRRDELIFPSAKRQVYNRQTSLLFVFQTDWIHILIKLTILLWYLNDSIQLFQLFCDSDLVAYAWNLSRNKYAPYFASHFQLVDYFLELRQIIYHDLNIYLYWKFFILGNYLGYLSNILNNVTALIKYGNDAYQFDSDPEFKVRHSSEQAVSEEVTVTCLNFMLKFLCNQIKCPYIYQSHKFNVWNILQMVHYRGG